MSNQAIKQDLTFTFNLRVAMEGKANDVISDYQKEKAYYEQEYLNRVKELENKYREKLYTACESYCDGLLFEEIDNCIERYLKYLK